MNTYNLTEIELQPKRYIHIGGMCKELLPTDNLNESFVFEFNGQYQLEISNVDGVLKVTNGVNGWGNNCKDEFKNVAVEILQVVPPLPSGAKKEDIQPVPKSFVEKIQSAIDWIDMGEFDGKRPDTDDIRQCVKELREIQSMIRKQSLVEIMEADQRDGIYGVREGATEQIRADFSKSEIKIVQEYLDFHGISFLHHSILSRIEDFALWVVCNHTPLPSEDKNANVNRVEVIDERGRSYVNWKDGIKVFLDYQDGGKTLKVFIRMQNNEQGVQVSDTTEAKSADEPMAQNTTKEPALDNLRDKFFKECTDTIISGGQKFAPKVNTAPHDLFKWFKPYLKSNSEPVIGKMGIGTLRSLINQFDKEEISMSKFLEEINNHFLK